MLTETYVDGRLRERRDDTTRTVTTYDDAGALVPSTPEAPNPRPYTATENAAADAAEAERVEQAAYEAQQAVDRAILDATAALMADAHTDGEAWTQPIGAHDAVPLDRTVTLDGKTWRSLHPANVWRPDPSSRYWEVVSGEPGPEPWSAGTYYRIDNKVTYNGQTWNCTYEHLGQVGWEPGAAGMYAVWKLI